MIRTSEIKDLVFDAVEVHHGFEDDRHRVAIRSYWGGTFVLWQSVPADAWEEEHWERCGNCYSAIQAREWVGKL